MKVALVAGEASGDLLGAGLIREIRARVPGALFEGVAGPAMVDAGCVKIEDADTLAVMGLIEPLREVPRLLRLRRSLLRRWTESPPDVFVGIDAPDFNFGLEKKLRRSGVPTVHYVSPTIWAWRPGRVKTVRNAADRVLCIFPFEKAIYDEQGVEAVFVGNPRADRIPTDINSASARHMLGLGTEPVVAVLPGSRRGEVARLAPLFVAAARSLAAENDRLRFITPAASPRLGELIQAEVDSAGITDRYAVVNGDSIEVMAAADVVLLASGTAALEAALLCKPTVAAYRVSRLSAFLLRSLRLLKTEYVTMPNLLTETPQIPEFIQEAATPEALAGAVRDLLVDADRRRAIAERFAKLRQELALGADSRAAEAVISLVNEGKG